MKAPWKIPVLSMILSCDFLAAQAYSDRFTESLVIRPLEDGKVASLFTFTTLMAHASGRDPINDSEDKRKKLRTRKTSRD